MTTFRTSILRLQLNILAVGQLFFNFKEFKAYEVKAGFKDSAKPIRAEPVHIIEDDEEDNVPYSKPVNPWKEGETKRSEGDSKNQTSKDQPHTIDLDINKNVIDQEELADLMDAKLHTQTKK